MDNIKSKEIYDTFMQGAFINKSNAQGDRLVPNPLFDELANEFTRQQYSALYLAIGYELNQMGNSFFVNRIGESGQPGEVAMKIMVLFDLLHRAMTYMSCRYSQITEYSLGIDWPTLQQYNQNEEFQKILQAVGLKDSFTREIEKVLFARQLAFKNHRERLVLTDAGIALSADFLNDTESAIS
ncbi:condensin complex protein MksE [Endozoicomonas numazuensis]|uniref:Uncharacterized protein n=1 Tax=Endozoicomonas numazuensis TaxID=1137799 RepID=A0A081NLT6_9GAMM|nr:hypothetical protein [Endozoicomonas numazuensis]KEQ19409.1 hypothetical protein GZ78_05505 [Endozoicomonas numazuensis]